MHGRKLGFFCIILLSFFIIYFSLFKINAKLKEKEFILNIRGLEIQTVNEQLDLATLNSIKKTRYEYNYHTLVFLGCSGELDNIEFLDQEKLLNLYKGIGLAIQKLNLSVESIEDPCIKKVMEKYNNFKAMTRTEA